MKSAIQHNLAKRLTLLLLLCLPASAWAEEEKWYKVELIVFEHTQQRSVDNELWPHEIMQPDFDTAYSLIPLFESPDDAIVTQIEQTVKIPIPFQSLADVQMDLRGVLSQLELSSRYRPLLHTGWIQPPAPLQSSRSVRILPTVFEPQIEELVEAVATEIETTPLPEPVLDQDLPIEPELDTREAEAPPIEVDGTLRLSVARYIHVELDLLFNELVETPVESKPVEEPAEEPTVELDPAPQSAITDMLEESQPLAPRLEILRQFRISEKRRLRSKERHYFDHPRFGVVLQVVPIKVMLPDEETAEKDAIAALPLR